MKFDPITLDTLRQEKGYQKVLRKQQKELESLRKRHHKEKLTVQKQHCVAIEKIIKGKKLVIFSVQFVCKSVYLIIEQLIRENIDVSDVDFLRAKQIN